MIKSRSYSLTVGIKLRPKSSTEQPTEPIQHAKNSHRFLGYGPEADTCLWNMFDAQKVSEECASALIYINDSGITQLDQYADMYNNGSTSFKRIQMTVSGSGLCLLLLICVIYVVLDDDEDDDDENGESAADSDEIAYVAVPLTVV